MTAQVKEVDGLAPQPLGEIPYPDITEDCEEAKIRDADELVAAAEGNLYRITISCGPSSPQTRRVATDLVLAYNHFGMKLLAENEVKVGAKKR